MFARGYVNGLVAGTALLDINSIDGLSLWVDGKPVNSVADPIELGKGRHTLTFGFDLEIRSSGLRVRVNAADAQGRFQPEGGL